MFASVIPLALFSWLLFAPPADLSQSGLFWWLTCFSILVRIALTLFVVPFLSLGAELSTDYKERTSITASRLMFAAFLSPVVMVIGYVFYFVPTETYKNGLINQAAYPKFALLCGILMAAFILISAWGTRKVIPSLPKASSSQAQMTTADLLSSIVKAFKMPSFRSLVFFTMFLYVGLGVGITFTPYFAPYYFGFTAQKMGHYFGRLNFWCIFHTPF